MNCKSCTREIPTDSRLCPYCGTKAKHEPAGGATVTSPASRPHQRDERPSTPPSSHSSYHGQFLPGTMLTKRYRIVSLLGKGGMGEVYRADDLELGQLVALKFLPEDVTGDPNRLARLRNEVRVARRVSHANVCRVYDLSEVEGRYFLSMEYIDGEDLSGVLRRMGRPSKEKAVEIARQLCAGLAAAHENDVLHRDLKPANVMIDGRGRVRITDFGLANLADEIRPEDIRAGTPAYMAPEQLAGQSASVRSDIYSLGLVLFEVFTGKRAYDAESVAEIKRLQISSSPTSLSTVAPDIDPAVERVILRCLEVDPRNRPGSALAVAMALPGGDPLAAALAAGETPSPGMVAEAGGVGGLRPGIGVGLLVFALIGLAAWPFMSETVRPSARIGLPIQPEVLAAEARRIVEEAGYQEAPLDHAFAFELDRDYYELEIAKEPLERWRNLATIRPAPIFFWYRQSPRLLQVNGLFAELQPDDPPPIVSGMVGVWLDPRGRLLRFEAIPPQLHESGDAVPALDWKPWFERAGLNFAQFETVAPKWNTLSASDVRHAWEGTYAGQPDIPVRVEAGAFRGRPVYYFVVLPWTKPQRMETSPWQPGQKVAAIITVSLLMAVLVGGGLMARHNLRLGRADRRGALRLAAAFFVLMAMMLLTYNNHVPSFAELEVLMEASACALFFAALIWVLCIAIEPYFRRLWPSSIVSWNRMLQGRFRDPMIGRDILIGSAAGVAMATLSFLNYVLPERLGLPTSIPFETMHTVQSAKHALASYFSITSGTLVDTIFILSVFLVLRVIFRREWLAAIVFVPLLVVTDWPHTSILSVVINTVGWSMSLFVLLRFGMLAFLFAGLFRNSAGGFAFTTDLSAWYFTRSVIPLFLLGALTAWAFYVSLAGRSLFADPLGEK